MIHFVTDIEKYLIYFTGVGWREEGGWHLVEGRITDIGELSIRKGVRSGYFAMEVGDWSAIWIKL
jgi:hypothetical protein